MMRQRIIALSVSVALMLQLAPVVARADDMVESTNVVDETVLNADSAATVDQSASDAAVRTPDVDIPKAVPASSEPGLEPADEVVTDGGDVDPANDELESLPTLAVEAHVQRLGWAAPVGSGGVAGTISQGLRLEALKMTVSGTDTDGAIQYRAHVQNEGWQSWRADGDLAGSVGAGRRVEAVRIRLTGTLAERYDIWYQVHVQRLGWLAPTHGGASAGTTGRGLRVEALRVWLQDKDSPAPANAAPATSYASLAAEGLAMKAHVQKLGWQGAVGDGETVGTTGRGLRLEAFTVSAANLDVDGSVLYRAHVQGEGWQSWRADGDLAGSVGAGRRVEAVQMRLTGELAERYDVYYRAHVQNVGWLAWAKGDSTGVTAGSIGQSLRVEAIQACLVERGGAAPVDTDAAFSHAEIASPGLTYAAYLQNVGWTADVSAGATAGATGRSLRMEALRASLAGGAGRLAGSISYRAHVQGVGWQGWVGEGATAGTTGQALRMEAFEMRLSGKLANVYSIWYRAHVQDAGWLGWAHDGETAGSTGAARRVEAVQVVIAGKGAAAPGSTANHHVTAAYFLDGMGALAQAYSSPTGQLIMVDLAAHRVGIYAGTVGGWQPVRSFPCSVGAPGTRTVRGVFSIGSRGYVFGNGFSCYYWTQFYGAYLFHSILYRPGTFTVQDGRLGMDISHGCVRLPIDDARYINENIRSGTTVVVY